MLAQDVKMITPDLPVMDMGRARAFYEEVLGFSPASSSKSGVMYQLGATGGLYLYSRSATRADHTEASFLVDDLEKEVQDLRGRGVEFEEYDMPGMGIKTVNGIATMEDGKAAWFRDTEGNILSLNQHLG